MIEWSPIILTFKLAAVTTVILLFLSMPLAYWLAFTKSRSKYVVETLVSLPLILPPTVLGFYLLITFSPNNAVGGFIEDVLGLRLVFSFTGLVVGSVIYSLPFMVQPIQSGFGQVPRSLIEASAVLGKSSWTTLYRVLIPNARPAILSGLILSFAHTIGEFGVVLMLGGNIPGVTKVASIAIYDEVQILNYPAAHVYSAFLLVVSFTILLAVHLLNGGILKLTHDDRA
jgi:molybdate transport system permease protein